MSATRGISMFFLIFPKTRPDSKSGTATLIISQPAFSKSLIWLMVWAVFLVGVLVIDWIAMGLFPPIFTPPIFTVLVLCLFILFIFLILFCIFYRDSKKFLIFSISQSGAEVPETKPRELKFFISA